VAVPLSLVVGDGIGGADADVVRYVTGASTNQIGDVAVLIQSSGLLDLNGISDTINAALTMVIGSPLSGSAELLTGGAVCSRAVWSMSSYWLGSRRVPGRRSSSGAINLNGAGGITMSGVPTECLSSWMCGRP